MNKHDIIDTIQQYLAGTLDQDQRVQLEQLIAEDPVTATLFDEYKMTFLAIRAGKEEKLKDDLTKWDNTTG
jgi:anti-sigma-K factor RskA